jgi:DNA invertase Pin-like site-specific DNA recombinase
MIKHTEMTKTPRDHFMRAVEDELAKFERKEKSFRQALREERAAQLRLPFGRNFMKPGASTRLNDR